MLTRAGATNKVGLQIMCGNVALTRFEMQS